MSASGLYAAIIITSVLNGKFSNWVARSFTRDYRVKPKGAAGGAFEGLPTMGAVSAPTRPLNELGFAFFETRRLRRVAEVEA